MSLNHVNQLIQAINDVSQTHQTDEGLIPRYCRIAIIDAAFVAPYTPTNLPFVQFEGETDISLKTYQIINPAYFPLPGDRVIMMPVGRTYVIVGPISTDGSWTSYVPILKSFTSGLTVATSSAAGHYKIMGKTIFVQGEVTASALAAQATVSLPFAGSRRFLNCGSMVCFGTSTPADQSYCARMLDTNANSLILVGTTGGFRDCASGNSLDWSVTYDLP